MSGNRIWSQKLPGGLIIQWGFTGSTGFTYVTFPISFPNSFLSGSCASSRYNNSGAGQNYIGAPSTSGMYLTLDGPNGAPYSGGWWMAIGY